MLFDRSLVLAPDARLRIEVVGDRPATLSVDGRNLGTLHQGDAVTTTAAAPVGPLRDVRAPQLPAHPQDQVRPHRPMRNARPNGSVRCRGTHVLVELAVRDLGVIAELRLVLGPGMTALTGETGAGKTMVVEAIELLVGGRADAALVRTGAERGQGRGPLRRGGDDARRCRRPDEVVIARVIPRAGRSRAYLDGRLATVAELAELGPSLVDLHGQHAHQSLLRRPPQRAALDRLRRRRPGAAARRPRVAVADIDRRAGRLGGDERARAREIDLAPLPGRRARRGRPSSSPTRTRPRGRGGRARRRHGPPRGRSARRRRAQRRRRRVASTAARPPTPWPAVAALAGRAPFAAAEARLRAVAAELTDVAAELRAAGETIDEDPERLDAVRAAAAAAPRAAAQVRRDAGRRDRRTRRGSQSRLAELEGHDERAAAARRRAGVAPERRAAAAAAEVAAARRAARPRPGRVASRRTSVELAMPKAELSRSRVEGRRPRRRRSSSCSPPTPGARRCRWPRWRRVASWPGPCSRCASCSPTRPPTLVFDEVDAGIGGEAAVAVGRALAAPRRASTRCSSSPTCRRWPPSPTRRWR